MFQHVETYPGDPILSLMETFQSDARADMRYSGADMSKPEQIEDMVATTAHEFGAVDIRAGRGSVKAQVGPLHLRK